MEVEAKFRVPDEGTYQRLLNMTTLAGFRLGEVYQVEIHDHYLDTADRAIWSAGYACRIRRQNERYLATIKTLGQASGGIHRRVEYEVSLPGPLTPQEWPPGAVHDVLSRISDHKPLLPLFEIEQDRHSRLLYELDRHVAEFSLDHVRARWDDAIFATFLELEVELLPGAEEEDLDRVIAGLREIGSLEPQNQSKFERTWTLLNLNNTGPQETGANLEARSSSPQRITVAPIPPDPMAGPFPLLDRPGIVPDDPMSEAGRKTMRFHYQRMLHNEPGTRMGQNIEALHDMRVATRRMRAAFQVFGAYYKRKAIASYIKGLKRTGRALGRVRDLDVFREKMFLYLDTLPQTRQRSLDGLLATIKIQRQTAREKMIAYLDSAKYSRFRDRFGEFVETEGMGRRSTGQDDEVPRPFRVRHVAPVSIYERLASVRAYDDWVRTPDPPLTRLHELRIACKRLRYAMEFFEEVLGPNTKATIKEVVAMQDHLGGLQDTVVASSILQGFLASGTYGHDTAQCLPETEAAARDPGVEAYLAANQHEMQRLLGTFPQAWRRLTDSEFSQMVAETIMVL